MIINFFPLVCSYAATVECNIPDNICSGEAFNGTCTVDYKGKTYNPSLCKMMMVGVQPNTPNSNTCIIHQATPKNWVGIGCKVNFTILCSKENVSIDLQCMQSNNKFTKKINGM